MSRREMAGLFMTHYSDRAWDDPAAERERVRRAVAESGVAGFCVFGGELARTRAFISDMEGAAGHGLLVASDLEQGLGQQLQGGTVFPSQMAIGATGSTDLAERVGRAVALEARAVGVNVVFAPVADLATEPSNPIIGTRAYGSDPSAAAELTAAYVRGCQSARVAATAKHFPGHGATAVDSHIDLPAVAADRVTLDERELAPFRAVVAEDVRVVMVAHVAFPALAGLDVPATLSPEICGGLLRDELGFGGLVVTDALNMGAITKRHGAAEASVLALEAGADLLLMPEDLESAIDGVCEAVESGRVSEERVERSLARIEELRSWLARGDGGGSESGRPGDAPARAYRQEHRALARDVAERAVTLMAGSDGGRHRVPAGTLDAGHVLLAALVDEERAPDLTALPRLVADAAPGATLLTLTNDAVPDELSALVDDAGRASALVLLVFDRPAAWRGRKGPSEALTAAAAQAIEAAPESVAVVFAGPELASAVSGAGTVLCCYDGSPPMQEAALAVLRGEAEPRGDLPAPAPRLPDARSPADPTD